MTYILDSKTVYVVMHLYCDTIFNTVVFAKYDDAVDYYHKMIIDYDGEYDYVDFQTCEIV